MTKKNKKILIYYFSGTGNTKWIVNKMAETLLSLYSYDVSIVSYEKRTALMHELDNVDMVGIAYPIHSSKPPSCFEASLKTFPVSGWQSGIPLFLIATAGYMCGDVNRYTAGILKKRGLVPFLGANFIVGNNLHLPGVSPTPVTKVEKLEKRTSKLEEKVIRISHFIAQKRRYFEGNGPAGTILGVAQRSIGKVYENGVFPQFYADGKCIRCGLCIRNCPVLNIHESDNHIEFHKHCMHCMRCYNFCPVNAIQSSPKSSNTKKYPRYEGMKG